MALHRIIEKHQVNILGQEITYTNRFLKYSKSTSYGFKPSKSLVSSGVYVFKYTYEHHSLPPTLLVSPVSGKKYIVPIWQEVHPQTTLADIEWIKPEPKVNQQQNIPIIKEEFKFESKSDPGSFYVVRVTGDKIKCNCPGSWRAADRRCKHIKEVEKIKS